MADGAATKVTGLSKTLREFRRLGASTDDVKNVTRPIAKMVAEDAQRNVPVRSRALQKSIRGLGSQSRVSVKAGRTSAPYAAPIEYGWKARGIKAAAFLRRARDKNLEKAKEMLLDNITDLAKRYGFTVH